MHPTPEDAPDAREFLSYPRRVRKRLLEIANSIADWTSEDVPASPEELAERERFLRQQRGGEDAPSEDARDSDE